MGQHALPSSHGRLIRKSQPSVKADASHGAPTAKTSRIQLFDNMKALAIILVVLGHFLMKAVGIVNSHVLITLLTFIYLFHMPLFLFCSGIFAGRTWYKRHEAQSDKVLLYLILYGVFLLLIVLLDTLVLRKTPSVNPFVVVGAPWFMLVLALFMLMVPIIGSSNPVAFILISIVIAVGSGLFLQDAGTLSLSRAFVYLPYFALGFYLGPNNIATFVDAVQTQLGSASRRIIAAALGIVAIFLLMYFFLSNDQLTLIKLISTGRNLLTTVSSRNQVSILVLIAMRLMLYPVVCCLGALMILLCPKEKCFFTFIGERSFQVYILHMLVIYTFDNYHMYGGIIHTKMWIMLSPFIFTAILSPLLAWPKGPNDLVKKCSAWTKKITKPRSHPLEKIA